MTDTRSYLLHSHVCICISADALYTVSAGKAWEKGHRCRQAKHPHIKAECVATSGCTLISYPATEGKVSSRGQDTEPAGAFASPEPPNSAGDTFRDWHEQATALHLPPFRNKSSNLVLLLFVQSGLPLNFHVPPGCLSLLEPPSSQAQARMSCPSCTAFEI